MLYCRIFDRNDSQPSDDAVLATVRTFTTVDSSEFQKDDRGWFHAEWMTSAGPFQAEVFQTDEGIRGDLMSWAAWLEQNGGDKWMIDVIASRRLWTVRHDRKDIDAPALDFLHRLAQAVLAPGEGIYQIDERGFFDRTGRLLVAEHV